MQELIFATNNQHKIKEISPLIPSSFLVLGLEDIGFSDEIPETANTLEGNALLKARYITNKYHCSCFADDTGLEVEALNGAPGIYSARFAGDQCDSNENIRKLLLALKNSTNRKARFRTVIALIMNRSEYFFEGTVKGDILLEPRGIGGFGYDPVFQPEGFDQCFAEMTLSAKNQISHRAMAALKLIDFLKEQY